MYTLFHVVDDPSSTPQTRMLHCGLFKAMFSEWRVWLPWTIGIACFWMLNRTGMYFRIHFSSLDDLRMHMYSKHIEHGTEPEKFFINPKDQPYVKRDLAS